MNKKRELQFNIIEKVKSLLIQWATDQGIPLKHVEVVVPFVDNKFDLHVVLFMGNNADLETYRQNGTTIIIQERCISYLKQYKYPETWLEQVTVEFDSKENVDLNYDGSYFYRIR